MGAVGLDAAQTVDAPISKAAKLRKLVYSDQLEFLMEAHDGLSAKIVEETGFKGIWASGLSMSAALGVRDNNEASWTQILEVLEFMSDATTIPILVDGDTGWGNFNNMRRAVMKLCQRGVAGICIEDKIFPKTNSFIGEGQPLADIDEFCGKIKAGKDSQTDPDFVIIARIEALISGWGMDEALKRAEAYHGAGADAVLIHSKKSDADEVLAFSREWAGRCPVVVVPTKYPDTPTSVFEEAGVSVAIWANHNLRAAITSMRDVSRRIFRDHSIAGVERDVVSVSDVFELAGNDELADAERRYLPSTSDGTRAIVLAADALWRDRQSEAEEWVRDFVSCSRPFSGDYLADDPVSLTAMGPNVAEAGIHGEWIGLARLSAKGSALVREELESMIKEGGLQKASLVELFNRLVEKGHAVRVVYVPGQWLDVDDATDLLAAGRFL